LPMPSVVRVTNLENGRALVVRINDRGPFAHGRIIDLSRRSAQLLGFMRQGTARIRVQILAEKSRKIAQRMKGGYTAVIPPIANNAPKPDAAPMTEVSITSLSPIPGTKSLKKTDQVSQPKTKAKAESAVSLARHARGKTVVQYPVTANEIYVQVASFSKPESAQKFQKVVADLGMTGIYPAIVRGKPFHRVRIGPLKHVNQADSILEKLIKRGYPGARVIVETNR